MLTNLPNPEQRLNAFFRAFDGIQLVIDKQGRILDYKSDEGAFLRKHGSIKKSIDFQDLFPDNVREKYDTAIMEIQKGGRVAYFEYHLPDSMDDTWYESRLVPLTNGQTLMFIRNITQYKRKSKVELSQTFDLAIASWTRALHLRDQETEDHTRRVTVISIRLARKLGITSDELTDIKRGAILHDIGKMAIPDSILLKPGPLTDNEWAIMKKHPLIAVDILKPVTFLTAELAIPRSHHEKWDGSGYPDGLAGEDIPLHARIFAFADVYDALTSARSYRPAWTKQDAIAYIREQSGRHFDPSIVPVFIDMVS